MASFEGGGSLLNRLRFLSRRRTQVATRARCAHRPATRMYSLDPSVELSPKMSPKCRSLSVKPTLKELSEQQTESIFEKMMDEMNLTENLRAPLRKRTFNDKRQMLVLHVAGANLADGDLASVDDYIVKLSNPCLAPQQLQNLLESVRVALSSKPISWVAQFSEYGMDYLLLTLSRYYYKRNGKHEKIILECVRCLRFIISSKNGVQFLLDACRAMDLLVKLLDSSYPLVMIETAKALSELCTVSQPEGCKRVMSSFTINFEHNRVGRFAPILAAMMRRIDPLTVACLQLINCILNTAGDGDLKKQIKDELMVSGLNAILDETMSSTHNLIIRDQIKRFWAEGNKPVQRNGYWRQMK